MKAKRVTSKSIIKIAIDNELPIGYTKMACILLKLNGPECAMEFLDTVISPHHTRTIHQIPLWPSDHQAGGQS